MYSVQKIKLLLMALFLLSCLLVEAQMASELPGAFSQAQETHKKVLLIFSGSDWCAACIRFEKNILDDSHFQQFATENLVVVKADFPQRTKLGKEVARQNEALAERYNPKGQFPAILLLEPDGSVAGSYDYSNEDAVNFIAFLKKYIL